MSIICFISFSTSKCVVFSVTTALNKLLFFKPVGLF